MAQMRLDKYLAGMGIATRKELRQIIRSGRVTVNGVTAAAPDMRIDADACTVALDGEALRYSQFHYYMLYKPCGVVTATEDGRQGTVMDLVTPEMRRMGLFPVGRLDKDTSGLLLLTDDGDFAHRVISPKSDVEKLYLARVDGALTPEDAAAFERGIILADGTQCLPARLDILAPDECRVAVMEGKYHQVRRMLAACGKPVITLKRLSIGALSLDSGMAEGDFRELDQAERALVFAAI
mgnify:FL=1